jgi:hypothetical protein
MHQNLCHIFELLADSRGFEEIHKVSPQKIMYQLLKGAE